MTEAFGRILNIVDVEATCWEGDPPTGQVNEITEIGLIVVDLERREGVERARILVRPERSGHFEPRARMTSFPGPDARSAPDACAIPSVSAYRYTCFQPGDVDFPRVLTPLRLLYMPQLRFTP